MPAFSLPSTPRALTSTLRRGWERSPTKTRERAFRSFGEVLEPRLFSVREPSTSDLLRTL